MGRWSGVEGAGKARDEDMLVPGREVLFLGNSYTAFPEPSGGSRHAAEVARRWLSAGQPLSFMTTGTGIENLRLDGFSGPFRRLPGRVADRLPVPLLYLARALQALLHMPWRSPAVVYGTSDMLPDVLPAFLYRLLARGSFWAGCVFHLVPPPPERAGSGLVNRLSYAGQRLSLMMIKAAADLVIIDNEVLAGRLEELGFDASGMLLTRMGADAPAEVPGERDGPDACYVGRLHPSKGVFELVDIWKEVAGALPGSRLALAGSGPEPLVADLQRAIAEAGLQGQVELLGYLPRERLEELLGSCRVFVSASREEGFGISLVEAMSFGLPVVASALPHYSRLFGDAVIQAPPGDARAFAARVMELLGNDRLRRDAARRSRECAGRFTWEEASSAEVAAVAAAARKGRAPRAGRGSRP